MSLSLGKNEKKSLLVIYSIAENYYKIKDIYYYMDKKSIFINDHGYFEKYYADDRLRCLKYSITNMENPGYLDREKIDNSKVTGISFFMQLPMNIDPLAVFNEMYSDAKEFSKKYKGVLYDSNKMKLSGKAIKILKIKQIHIKMSIKNIKVIKKDLEDLRDKINLLNHFYYVLDV